MIDVPYIGGPEDAGKAPDMGSGGKLEIDEDIGAVVVGFDRTINYYKIQYAQLCINENEGCCVVTRRKHSIEVRLKATAAPFNSVLKVLGHRQVDTPRAISSPK